MSAGVAAKLAGKVRYLADEVLFRRDARRRVITAGDHGHIACRPERPNAHAAITHIAAELGYRISTRLDGAALVVYWEDATFRTPPPELRELSDAPALNIGCTDISKSRVGDTFEEVFGYSLDIGDPLAYTGPAVEKPEENAVHAGRIVECPTQPRVGFVYSVLVDNVVDGEVEDLRAPVFGGSIPFVYVKRRPVSDRFSNTNTSARIVETVTVLTDEEQQAIASLVAALSGDYVEVDCLRDRTNGNLYVVDVNSTPWGPPNHLVPVERDLAIERMAEAFRQAFF